jgi:hypothetical protein
LKSERSKAGSELLARRNEWSDDGGSWKAWSKAGFTLTLAPAAAAESASTSSAVPFEVCSL